MPNQQSNNLRSTRANSGGAASQSDDSSNRWEMILSRLSVLDGIAGDIAEIKQTQRELSDKVNKCLKSVEAHEKVLKQHESSLQKCTGELKILKASHSTLKEDVSGLRSQLGSVDVVALEKTSNMLESELMTFKDVLKHSASTGVTEAGCSESSSCAGSAELLERVRRANNIIVRNVPESADVEADKATVHDIISKIREGSAGDVVSIRRLGKLRQGAHRPIKVEFSNLAVPAYILRHRRILASSDNYRTISIDDDRTPLQIKHLHDLRKELDTRRSSGEADLTIKYKRGIPSIVKLPSSKN